MRILVVDDQVLFREGLVSLLRGYQGITVVGQVSTVAESIVAARSLLPDLILMDFTLPDGTGLDATQTILSERPETNIVFLTIHEQDERLFAAIRAGAKGYLLKNVPTSELVPYLHGVMQGEAAITLSMASHILQELYRSRHLEDAEYDHEVMLTSREVQILQEMATNATNQEIADRLYITENTVKVHVHRILAKLNCKNRREAVKHAKHHNLI